jgi:hypothetical protein
MKMPTGSSIENAELRRYLFHEMSDQEREQMEERLFSDDELFFEAADLENELVDRYARSELDADDTRRFERSLDAVPERRLKVANAAALRTYIEDERTETAAAPAAESTSFWTRISEIFTVRMPMLGPAAAGLLVLLAAASVLLVLDNRRKSSEIARLESGRAEAGRLQTELEAARAREAELAGQIDSEREASGDLTEELQRERERRERLEAQIEALKREPQPRAESPTIATLVLSPTVGGRGSGGGDVGELTVAPSTRRIALNLGLPDTVKAGERLSVTLNRQPLAKNLVARATGNRKSLQVTVPKERLSEGPNLLGVEDATGEVARYAFEFRIKK